MVIFTYFLRFLPIIALIFYSISSSDYTSVTTNFNNEYNDSELNKTQEEFEVYIDKKFNDYYGKCYFDMYIVNDYEKYNLDKPSTNLLDCFKTSDYYKDMYHDLYENYDYDSLDENHKFIYDSLIYVSNLYNTSEHYEDSFYSNFNVDNGNIYSINTTFELVKFDNESEINDYLIVLDQFNLMFDYFFEEERTKAKTGIYLQNQTLDYVSNELERFIDINANGYVITFDERIDAIEFLDDKQKQDYKEKNKDIVTTKVIPSYINAIDLIDELKGSSDYTGGIINYPNGKEYYEFLFSMKGSTSINPEEFSEMLFEEIQLMNYESVQYYYELEDEYLSDFMTIYDEKNPVNTVELLFDNYKQYFPTIDKVDYSIDYLHPSITDPNVLGYYMEMPYDNINNNQMMLNKLAIDNDPLSGYNTIAHEAIPGHMYQYVYNNMKNIHPITKLSNSIGITEGWAVYSSYLAYDFIDFENEALKQIQILQEKVGYANAAYADIAINYLGYTQEDLENKFLEIYSEEYAETLAEHFYNSSINMPGTILPYAVGRYYMDLLHDGAQEKLQEDFDYHTFHKAILDSPFSTYEQMILNIEEDLDIEF